MGFAYVSSILQCTRAGFRPPVFANEVEKLLLGQVLGLGVQNVEPVVRHRGYMPVAFLQGLPFQKLPKDLRLEDLDELQLSTPLQLKPLQR